MGRPGGCSLTAVLAASVLFVAFVASAQAAMHQGSSSSYKDTPSYEGEYYHGYRKKGYEHNDYDKYERKYEKQYGGYETYSAEEEAYGHHGGPEPHGAAYNPHYEQHEEHHYRPHQPEQGHYYRKEAGYRADEAEVEVAGIRPTAGSRPTGYYGRYASSRYAPEQRHGEPHGYYEPRRYHREEYEHEHEPQYERHHKAPRHYEEEEHHYAKRGGKGEYEADDDDEPRGYGGEGYGRKLEHEEYEEREPEYYPKPEEPQYYPKPEEPEYYPKPHEPEYYYWPGDDEHFTLPRLKINHPAAPEAPVQKPVEPEAPRKYLPVPHIFLGEDVGEYGLVLPKAAQRLAHRRR